MAKKEVKTDLWVYNILKEADLELEPQGSSIVEIDNALKTASKSGTGKVGFPVCGESVEAGCRFPSKSL